MGDRTPLHQALPVATRVMDRLAPYATRIRIAGSIRRVQPVVKDIEIVMEVGTVPDGLLGEERLALAEVREVAGRLGRVAKGGDRFIQITDTLNYGITTDLFLVHPPSEWGVQLAIRTGPAELSRELVTRIKGRLWRCKDGWVRDDRGRRVPCHTEREFFAAAGLHYQEPEERGVQRPREVAV